MRGVSAATAAALILLLLLTRTTLLASRTEGSREKEDDKERADEFKSWLFRTSPRSYDEKALKWPHVFPDGQRGVMALRDIKRGRVFFSIRVAEETTMSSHFAREFLKRKFPAVRHDAEWLQNRYVALSLFFMHHYDVLKSSSPFAPYLAILDRETDALSEWSSRELDELQNLKLKEHALAWNDHIKRDFLSVPAEVYEGLGFPTTNASVFNRFKYARNVLKTRCFGRILPKFGNRTEIFLVPFADLLNYSPACDENVEMKYDARNDTLYFRPEKRGFVKGEEICNGYTAGAGNQLLLLNYGFALHDNPNDELVFDAFRANGTTTTNSHQAGGVKSTGRNLETLRDRRLVFPSKVAKNPTRHFRRIVDAVVSFYREKAEMGGRRGKKASDEYIYLMEAYVQGEYLWSRGNFVTSLEEDRAALLTKHTGLSPEARRLKYALYYRIGHKLMVGGVKIACMAYMNVLNCLPATRYPSVNSYWRGDLRFYIRARREIERLVASKLWRGVYP